MSMFKRAAKQDSRLRLALIGPSGTGKSFTGLKVGISFAKLLGVKFCGIDTERGSLSGYADQFDFDVTELQSFSTDSYIRAIHEAENDGFGVCLIDSLSHAWAGKDGILEYVDEVRARAKSENSFTAWRTASPKHNDLVEAILTSSMHIIVTMRAKTEYVVEKDERTGKSVPRKIGLQPVQRDGIEYEFTACADIDLNHDLLCSKTRIVQLDGKTFSKPGEDFAKILYDWTQGVAFSLPQEGRNVPAPERKETSATQPAHDTTNTSERDVWFDRIATVVRENGFDRLAVSQFLCEKYHVKSPKSIPTEKLEEACNSVQKEFKKKEEPKKEEPSPQPEPPKEDVNDFFGSPTEQEQSQPQESKAPIQPEATEEIDF